MFVRSPKGRLYGVDDEKRCHFCGNKRGLGLGEERLCF